MLIVEEEHFKDVLKEAHPYLQAMAEQLGSRQDVLGTPAVVFGGMNVHDVSWLDYAEVDFDGDRGEYEENKWGAWEALEKLFGTDWKSRREDMNPKVFYWKEEC